MIDYTILYRSTLPVDGPWAPEDRWDFFISAFNESDRVKQVFEKASAQQKVWVVHHGYHLAPERIPPGAITPTDDDEALFVSAILDACGPTLPTSSICIDVTGMMRPHIMFLVLMLFERGVRRFDLLYSEPIQYVKQEQTQFSILPVVSVRPVLGFEGNHSTDTSNDLLIIGSGYDDALIAQVAEHKRSARKLQIFGLPSLRPDMYQENVLRARNAAEAVGASGASPLNAKFAPANDPFVIAAVLQETVRHENIRKAVTNLYLCPISTKPQAIGFALYYLHELKGSAASVIFPFSAGYSEKTSTGLSRICRYTVEQIPVTTI